MGRWKLLFGAEGLYGSTRGETTAQAWLAFLQANYNITPRLYWYVGLRYDDDRFSGFAYQEAVKTGIGYEFVQSDSTKLTAQALYPRPICGPDFEAHMRRQAQLFAQLIQEFGIKGE